ncbi:uncharacterized protein MELLADRAFT_87124 [Melampsora larici-populina 98AG31]|uniref:DNA endonuclease activator Ctp1 C-terminal domain-containing protein n=1 Tax=Melampsora larici-populina (strain 98AG31 / pathotype 3-4-7) TaxID=747676 RepID=F4R4L4_MELLP|nr:uncharacterized protein MELLADRAFT_87124 [Melampsora larici-populina 98AG31]EGG12828.1 hypothetical protein MELLADRAFT_87124 [Melampsora larici-populina 98AG31]
MLSRAALANIATPPTSLPPKKWIRHSDRRARAGRSVWKEPNDDSPLPGSTKGDSKSSKKPNEEMDMSVVHDSRGKVKSEKEADSPQTSTTLRIHPQERNSKLEDRVQDSKFSDPFICKSSTSGLPIESTTPATLYKRDRVTSTHASSKDRPLITDSKPRNRIASTSHEHKSDSKLPVRSVCEPRRSRPSIPSTPPATTYKKNHIIDNDTSSTDRVFTTSLKKPHNPHTSVLDDLDTKPSRSSMYQEGSSRNPIELTSPPTTDQRSYTLSKNRMPGTSIRPQKLFVCRELGLPPTPYTSRRIRHSSSVSPPSKLDMCKSEDETVKEDMKDDPFTAKSTEPKARREPRQRSPFEQYPGQNFMREIQKKRKEDLNRKRKLSEDMNSDSKRSSGGFMSRFEIDAENNFGVGHVFNEVARGKEARKQMHGADCDCCAGYYEQAAKDLRIPLKELPNRMGQHKNDISRHRHFNPPPTTPPGYWQMGFPDTPQVKTINRQAQENKRRKLEIVEAQAKWSWSLQIQNLNIEVDICNELACLILFFLLTLDFPFQFE